MLKVELTTEEHGALDDLLKEHYKADGEVFRLESDGTAKVNEFRAENVKLREAGEAKDAKITTLTTKYEKVDIEKYNELIAGEKDESKAEMIKKGDLAGLLEQQGKELKADFDNRIGAITTELESTKTALFNSTVKDELKTAAASAGVKGNALDAATDRALKDGWQLKDGAAVRIVNGDTKLSTDNAGQNETMAEYYKNLAGTDDYLFNPSGGGGGTGGTGTPAGVKTIPNDPVLMGQHAEGIADGTVVVEGMQ